MLDTSICIPEQEIMLSSPKSNEKRKKELEKLPTNLEIIFKMDQLKNKLCGIHRTHCGRLLGQGIVTQHWPPS